jgi:hypothetical protein
MSLDTVISQVASRNFKEALKREIIQIAELFDNARKQICACISSKIYAKRHIFSVGKHTVE